MKKSSLLLACQPCLVPCGLPWIGPDFEAAGKVIMSVLRQICLRAVQIASYLLRTVHDLVSSICSLIRWTVLRAQVWSMPPPTANREKGANAICCLASMMRIHISLVHRQGSGTSQEFLDPARQRNNSRTTDGSRLSFVSS